MKKLLLLIVVLCPLFNFGQNLLEFDRREGLKNNFEPFFESISDDNRLNNGNPNHDNLYLTRNYDQTISGFNRIQGIISARDVIGTYTEFKATHTIHPIDNEITTINCTQNNEDVIVSGTRYYNFSNIPGPHSTISDGILMVSNNPINFQHDLVDFNFNSLKIPGGDNFVFIIDAVKDNMGNLYAIGTITNNIVHAGTAFFLKLDNSYNIVDMRYNENNEVTFERITYDESNESIYIVGKQLFQHPIIAMYDINALTFTNKVFDLDESFFDIKKDPSSQELVVGWVDKHYHEIGLLFFDNQLNLLSARTWDNTTTATFSTGTPGEIRIYNSKPNSIIIGNNEIFIRGTGMRNYTYPNGNGSWYGNFYYNTSRNNYSILNTTHSLGRYNENSSLLLFQTMNGMHPWHPKRMIQRNNALVSFSEHPYINSIAPLTNNNSGVDFFINYNSNPSLTKILNSSTIGCNSAVLNSSNPMLYGAFSELLPLTFNQYFPLQSDYNIYPNLNLMPYTPIQGFCDGPSNPNYKLAAINTELAKIQSYRIYNTIGQLVAKNKGDNSTNVDAFMAKIRKESVLNQGIYLIEIQTDKGLIRKKELY